MICSCTFNSSIQKTNIIETLSCDATFCFTEEIVSIKTKIYTSKIKDMQAGKIIKISLDSKRNAPTERETLGYFYINEKNIYLLIAYDDETALSLSE